MAFTGSELLFQTQEDWRNYGPPKKSWSSSGAFFKSLEKYQRRDLKGDGVGEMALYSTLGGRGGSNYDYAFQFSSNASGVRFEIPMGSDFQVAQWSHFELENLTNQSLISGLSSMQERMTTTATRAHKSLSSLVWSDGTGLIAKGNGSWTITGNVIQFQNILDADKFETGDRLIFVSEANKTAAAAGQQPTTRAFADANPANTNGFLAVTGINRSLGQITVNVNANAAVPTVANTDWIGCAPWFGGDGTQGRRPIQGFFTYVPITSTDAAKDLFGVARADDVNRLAGWRVLLSGMESSWGVIGKMAATAVRAFGVPDESDSYCIYVGSQEMLQLVEQMESSSYHVIEATVGGRMDYMTALCLGVAAVQVNIPGFGPIKLVADQYLTDSSLTASQDRTYVMVNERDVYFGTTEMGLGWRNYDNQGGPMHQISGTQQLYAQYGSYANLYHMNPGHSIIASTRANS